MTLTLRQQKTLTMRVFSMTEGRLSDILGGWKWDENQDQDSFSLSKFLFFSLLGREGIGRYDEAHTNITKRPRRNPASSLLGDVFDIPLYVRGSNKTGTED